MIFKAYDKKGIHDPEEYYKFRLKWLDNTIKRRQNRGENISQKQIDKWYLDEKRQHKNQCRDFELLKRMQKDSCIIICAHHGHLPWLESCVKQLRKLNLYTILAYDNPIWDDRHNVGDRYPKARVMNMIDYLLIKPKTFGSGVAIPHRHLMYLASNTAKALGFKKVIVINGDIVLHKPENLNNYLNELDEFDAITNEYVEGRYFGTMCTIIKIDCLVEMWNRNFEDLYVINIGNDEGRCGRLSKELNMKVKIVDNPKESHHFHFKDTDATFYKELGLHHYHALYKFYRREKQLPDFEEWIDLDYINANERKILTEYWKTKDKNILNKWWI